MAPHVMAGVVVEEEEPTTRTMEDRNNTMATVVATEVTTSTEKLKEEKMIIATKKECHPFLDDDHNDDDVRSASEPNREGKEEETGMEEEMKKKKTNQDDVAVVVDGVSISQQEEKEQQEQEQHEKEQDSSTPPGVQEDKRIFQNGKRLARWRNSWRNRSLDREQKAQAQAHQPQEAAAGTATIAESSSKSNASSSAASSSSPKQDSSPSFNKTPKEANEEEEVETAATVVAPTVAGTATRQSRWGRLKHSFGSHGSHCSDHDHASQTAATTTTDDVSTSSARQQQEGIKSQQSSERSSSSHGNTGGAENTSSSFTPPTPNYDLLLMMPPELMSITFYRPETSSRTYQYRPLGIGVESNNETGDIYIEKFAEEETTSDGVSYILQSSFLMPIEVGDILVSLNEISFKGMSVPDALNVLRTTTGMLVLFIRKQQSSENIKTLEEEFDSSIVSQSVFIDSDKHTSLPFDLELCTTDIDGKKIEWNDAAVTSSATKSDTDEGEAATTTTTENDEVPATTATAMVKPKRTTLLKVESTKGDWLSNSFLLPGQIVLAINETPMYDQGVDEALSHLSNQLSSFIKSKTSTVPPTSSAEGSTTAETNVGTSEDTKSATASSPNNTNLISIKTCTMKNPKQPGKNPFARGSRLRKTVVAAAGGSLIGAGAVIMATPLHPIGHAMTFGGMGLLGTEFEGPRNVQKKALESASNNLNRLRTSYRNQKEKVISRLSTPGSLAGSSVASDGNDDGDDDHKSFASSEGEGNETEELEDAKEDEDGNGEKQQREEQHCVSYSTDDLVDALADIEAEAEQAAADVGAMTVDDDDDDDVRAQVNQDTTEDGGIRKKDTNEEKVPDDEKM